MSTDLRIYNPATIRATMEQKDTHIAQLEASCAKMREALKQVADLIDQSQGVAGLHMNGDLAPWSELQPGGRFEGWLPDFTSLLALDCGKDLIEELREYEQQHNALLAYWQKAEPNSCRHSVWEWLDSQQARLEEAKELLQPLLQGSGRDGAWFIRRDKWLREESV